MADKAHLSELAADLQTAIKAYDPKDISSRTKLQTALETMHRIIQPPEMVLMEQRLHVLDPISPVNADVGY